MNINKQILAILKEFGIRKDDGICYLISLYYGYKPAYIPDDLKTKVSIAGIIKEEDGILKWVVPLFDNQVTAFEWVKEEYVQMFNKTNPDKGKYVREAVARMKKIFAENPDIRKEDILGATEIYLKNTNSKYIMFPHYFLFKGSGAEKTSTILDWIDKYRLIQNNKVNITSDRRKLL